jgi:hypothetical protein
MSESETIAILDALEDMGFDDDAFRRLHHWGIHAQGNHKKPSIKAHREYCIGRSFLAGDNNEIVEARLRFVLTTYQRMNVEIGNKNVLIALSDAAYFGITKAI